MDLLEAGRRFRLAPELLRLYEENGLLQGVQAPDGTRHYGEEALQRAVSFRFLQQAGMELGTLKHFVRLAEQGSDTVGGGFGCCGGAAAACWRRSIKSSRLWIRWIT